MGQWCNWGAVVVVFLFVMGCGDQEKFEQLVAKGCIPSTLFSGQTNVSGYARLIMKVDVDASFTTVFRNPESSHREPYAQFMVEANDGYLESPIGRRGGEWESEIEVYVTEPSIYELDYEYFNQGISYDHKVTTITISSEDDIKVLGFRPRDDGSIEILFSQAVFVREIYAGFVTATISTLAGDEWYVQIDANESVTARSGTSTHSAVFTIRETLGSSSAIVPIDGSANVVVGLTRVQIGEDASNLPAVSNTVISSASFDVDCAIEGLNLANGR